MPELPEIETVKLQLGRVLPGKTVVRVELKNKKTVQGDERLLEGKKVVAVRRIAKVLLVDLEEDITVAFHFKMSGQLVFVGGAQRIVGGHPTADFVNTLPSSHTRVIFELDEGVLYFNDQRMFGWVKVGKTADVEKEKFFVGLGPEPFDITADEFVKRVSKSRKAIKLVIMDQAVITGVGNIYANDALWEAQIHPNSPANRLPKEQLELLFEKILLVLREGIQYGGATAADAKYIDLHGLGGTYQEHFRTYDQTGKPCKRCGSVIEKYVLGGRGTYVCLGCQKLGS